MRNLRQFLCIYTLFVYSPNYRYYYGESQGTYGYAEANGTYYGEVNQVVTNSSLMKKQYNKV